MVLSSKLDSNDEPQVIGRCERVMIRHDIVGVRKEKVILIVTGPFPFSLCQLLCRVPINEVEIIGMKVNEAHVQSPETEQQFH